MFPIPACFAHDSVWWVASLCPSLSPWTLSFISSPLFSLCSQGQGKDTANIPPTCSMSHQGWTAQAFYIHLVLQKSAANSMSGALWALPRCDNLSRSIPGPQQSPNSASSLERSFFGSSAGRTKRILQEHLLCLSSTTVHQVSCVVGWFWGKDTLRDKLHWGIKEKIVNAMGRLSTCITKGDLFSRENQYFANKTGHEFIWGVSKAFFFNSFSRGSLFIHCILKAMYYRKLFLLQLFPNSWILCFQTAFFWTIVCGQAFLTH